MLPRGAQDGIAKIFSKHGATIWFLNTYQVGGANSLDRRWIVAQTIRWRTAFKALGFRV